MPAGVPGGSTPPPLAHDGNIASVASRHNNKINPYRRRPGFPQRLFGSTTSAANPAIPASPTNPAIRFPFERPKGGCRKPVCCMVVAVTWAVVAPFSGFVIFDTVQLPGVGAPLQASVTDGLFSPAGARSTVKIALCPGTTVRLVQLVVSEKG